MKALFLAISGLFFSEAGFVNRGWIYILGESSLTKKCSTSAGFGAEFKAEFEKLGSIWQMLGWILGKARLDLQ